MGQIHVARRRGRVFLIVGALLVVVGLVIFVVGSVQRTDEHCLEREKGCAVLVELECEGWSSVNASLGVFAEGATADGGLRSEHLLFEGSGSRTVDFSIGECTAVPQLPQIMLQDGRVMGVDGPARACCTGDGEVRLKVAYEAADLRGVTDDELADIAAVSFLNEDAAAYALEAAKVLRDQVKDKEGSDE